MITITPDIVASPNVSVKPMFITKYADLAEMCLTFFQRNTEFIFLWFLYLVYLMKNTKYK